MTLLVHPSIIMSLVIHHPTQMSFPPLSLSAPGLPPWPHSACRVDPASASVPLMTTVVDATGLVLYFYIAELILETDLHAIPAALPGQ